MWIIGYEDNLVFHLDFVGNYEDLILKSLYHFGIFPC